MPPRLGIHHVAIICSNYERSKDFYHRILGLEILAEHYRANRHSWKLDLAMSDSCQIELFSFPNPPARPTAPEAQGLRHLAFSITDLDNWITYLNTENISTEPVRVDEYTGRRFTFFRDPDGLPLELYEIS